MTKKPVRKFQLSRETIRALSAEQLPRVAGGVTEGYTERPTCTLHEGTGPFPSHGACGGTIIIV